MYTLALLLGYIYIYIYTYTHVRIHTEDLLSLKAGFGMHDPNKAAGNLLTAWNVANCTRKGRQGGIHVCTATNGVSHLLTAF